MHIRSLHSCLLWFLSRILLLSIQHPCIASKNVCAQKKKNLLREIEESLWTAECQWSWPVVLTWARKSPLAAQKNTEHTKIPCLSVAAALSWQCINKAWIYVHIIPLNLINILIFTIYAICIHISQTQCIHTRPQLSHTIISNIAFVYTNLSGSLVAKSFFLSHVHSFQLLPYANYHLVLFTK